MPWTSTPAFPHPLVNIKLGQGSSSEPSIVNYFSYGVVEFLTWQGLGDVINQWRESIDLEHIAFSEGPCLIEKLKTPITYCWSPALVPKPADWGSNIDVCGFFFREPPDYTPAPELDEFLQSGPPPVYIGFGSIVLDDPQRMSEIILEAVRITGTRALLSRGWSKYESHRIVIETRRWDPFSGTIAAAIGVSADLAKSAADTVVKPVKAYQQRNMLDQEHHLDPTDSSGGAALHSLDARRAKNSRGCLTTTKYVSTVSAHSMSTFLKHCLNGLVIIPFAFTEGFRNVPLLYGEELRDYGEIYDWKSGITFGAKAFVFGVVDGVGGLFILPYEGAKNQGVLGAVKGIGKGVAGLTSRVFTATIGSATYPLQGIYKSIWRLVNSRTRQAIQKARLAEGKYLADKGHHGHV
ncbi:hypothetical protein NCS55_00329700 [Fusarium keratoplasticum]|nr:hypothetical protein NCS55_00329700 [Fusarium keratoplasticum]